MPIKPENRARYPKDWKFIRAQILARAGNCCEHEGCEASHYDVGYWRGNHWVRIASCDSHAEAKQIAAEEHYTRFGDEEGDVKIIVIVLTVAHLDHTPENCDPSNLRAWCQRHHLAYDHPHHQANAAATRKASKAAADLFAPASGGE